MKYAISNGGKSARALRDNLGLVDGEFTWDAELPGNPFDPLDTGLVIDGIMVRLRSKQEMQDDAAQKQAGQQQADADRAILRTQYQSDLDALQAIRDFSGIVTLTIVGQAVKTLAVVLIHVLKALKAVV